MNKCADQLMDNQIDTRTDKGVRNSRRCRQGFPCEDQDSMTLLLIIYTYRIYIYICVCAYRRYVYANLCKIFDIVLYRGGGTNILHNKICDIQGAYQRDSWEKVILNYKGKTVLRDSCLNDISIVVSQLVYLFLFTQCNAHRRSKCLIRLFGGYSSVLS